MVYSLSLNSNTNIGTSGLGNSSWFANNPIGNDSAFPSMFSPNGFNSLFGNMSSPFQLFDMFMNNKMPLPWQKGLFNQNFDTRTNMAALKKSYNPKLANKLANIAYKNAMARNSHHKCLAGARESFNDMGIVKGTMGGSAYQSAAVLAKNKNFKEVQVSREDLRNLPAGCVIVWSRNYFGNKSSDVHGHIAITLGGGKEASDHVSNKTYLLNSSRRVFVPVGLNHSG